MVKINDSFAFYAFKMLVIIQLAVESFDIARAFHYESCADFGKGQKGPIDRIQRDVRQGFPDLAIEHIGGRVLFGLDKLLVDCHSLGGYAQPGLAAPGLKIHHLFC